MAKYRKKPVVIEAFRLGNDPMPDWFCDARTRNDVITYGKKTYHDPFEENLSHAVIRTLEGDHRADIGDYVIKGVKGELYPCKPDIFHITYECVEE